ncbi:MAG: hypothetical protein ACR2LI_01055 [Propionibacteriaceae bacterium]
MIAAAVDAASGMGRGSPPRRARHRGRHDGADRQRAGLGLVEAQALQMRAMTAIIVVSMSGLILGPLLGGTVWAHVRGEWLLVVNAPLR